MAVLPEEIPTGLLTGQYYFVNEDTIEDVDANPQLLIVSGKVKITASVKTLRMSAKKAVVIPLVFDAKFNNDGHLVPDNGDGIGLHLPATNSTEFDIQGWTWKAVFELVAVETGHTVNLDPIIFDMPEGLERDLSEVIPSAASTGTVVLRGPKGDVGPDGIQGIQGIQGEVGPEGPAGLDGSNVLPTNDAVAQAIETEGPTKTALSAAFVPLSGLKVPLDIWPDYTGPNTYTDWITAIDTALAGGAVKSTIGTSSGAGLPIHAYTFGPASAPHALLVGGVHGNEVASAMSNWRWFEGFVKSTHPVMVALRERLRVTWIPFLNASQYRGVRPNSATVPVDINRNWPMNWAIESNPEAQRYKGASELSEPENIALKNLLDTTDISALIDCHTNEPNAPHLQVGATPNYIHMNHSVTSAALGVTKQLYAESGGVATTFAEWRTDWLPTLTNWFPKYVRWNRGRVNAASALVEIQSGMLGSSRGVVVQPFVTQAANRIQNGFITTWMLEWLEHGQSDGEMVAPVNFARISPPLGTSANVKEGGTLIPFGSALSTVMFENTQVNYLPVLVRAPGNYAVNYDIAVTNPGTTDSTVEIKVGFGPMTATGDAPKKTGGTATVRIPPGDTVVISRTMIDEVTPPTFNGSSTVYMAQLFIRALAGGASAQILPGFLAGSLTATPKPVLEPWPQKAPSRG